MGSQADRESEKAKGFVFAVIVAGLLLNLVSMSLAATDPGMIFVNEGLLAVLCLFVVYQRAAWARWLSAILFGVGGLAYLFIGVAINEGIVGFLGVALMISGGILASPLVEAHFRSGDDELQEHHADNRASVPDDGADDAMNELPSDPDDGADDAMNELPSDPDSGADERYVPINKDLVVLEEAAPHRFAYWPTGGVPRVAAGVYTIWRGAEFVYVGMAGRGNTAKKEQAKLRGKPWGLQARLNSHASGSRSDDQFCMYICDRFVIPTLSSAESHQVETEELSLDVPTRQFIRKELSFRFIETPDGDSAYNIASMAQQGALRAGKPLLNPLAVTVEKWAEEMAKLKSYKEENGNCDVSGHPGLPNFRSWVRLVRRERADERLKSTEYPILRWQLDKLGFIWDLGAFRWNQRFEELLAYKKEHGDCLVPRKWPENQQLSNWVDIQRRRRRDPARQDLSEDQVQKLDDIGFVWELPRRRWWWDWPDDHP